NPAAGRHRARLGDSHKFQGQVSVRGFAAGGHGADCPRTRLTSVRWDTGDVTVEDPAPRPDVAGYPAPREPKSRLRQDGRDMFWSLAPLVLACVVLAGLVGMCSFQLSGPKTGPVPSYDVAAALHADATQLG